MADQLIRFGKLSALYENGFLRYLRAGNQEVIRLIYLALRNQNWETAPMKITDEEIKVGKDGFVIQYQGTHVSGEKEVFQWSIKITGKATGEVTFEADGEGLNTYQRNRAGLCLLHPVRPTLGKPVTVVHPDGRMTVTKFPETISPHQPFIDIREFRWEGDEGLHAQIEFEGDIFEMEDQRNWTDASFKTYSTPLSLPMPVTLHRGDRIYQKITIRLSGLDGIEPPQSDRHVEVVVNKTSALPFPTIGTCHAAGQPLPDSPATARLKKLGFDHLRIELNFSFPLWPNLLDHGAKEAALLDLPVEFALVFDKSPIAEWDEFVRSFKPLTTMRVARISLFTTRRSSPDELLAALLPRARAAFPKSPVGSGSPAYFVDVNRYRFQFDQVDFVTWSVNPQVHAVDPRTMVENAEAQKDTVLLAREITGNKPIVVSPVTLRARSNPDATAEMERDTAVIPPDVDLRQATPFAAAWTLASLKNLLESGSSAITFYESHGMKGFLLGTKDDRHPDFKFQHDVFPVYDLFEKIHAFRPAEVLLSSSTDPLKLNSLVLKKDNQLMVIVANHTNDNLKFRLWEKDYSVNGLELVYITSH